MTKMMHFHPKLSYIDPQSQDHRAYHDHLTAYNQGLHRAVSIGLNGIFPQGLRGAVISTPGSDGRLEKGPVSLMEFLVIGDEHVEPKVIAQKVLDQYDTTRMPDLEYIESKTIRGTHPLSEFHISKDNQEIVLVSPARMFDAQYLFGDEELLLRAKDNFIDELKTPYGLDVFDHLRGRVKDHARVSLKGTQRYKGNDLKHFDIEGGVAFYDPVSNQQSFKQGPIRLVQYALTRDLVRCARETEESKELLDHIPTNTVGKIHTLEVSGTPLNIHSEQVRDLADSYKYFLWLYHRSQDNFKDGKPETPFDSAEVKDRLRSLDSICRTSIIKSNAPNTTL